MLSLLTNPPVLLSLIATLLISLTVHEFSHAWAAFRLGDTTARDAGRLTLNPAAHLDLIGTFMLLLGGFGWAKPVPVNPYTVQRRTPAGLMLVSLAGPVSNFLMAVLAAIPFRIGVIKSFASSSGFLPTAAQFLDIFIMINLGLMLFNLLPIAPLDGEKILEYILPDAWGRALERIQPYGPIILIALVMVLPLVGIDIFSFILDPVRNRLFLLLTGV